MRFSEDPTPGSPVEWADNRLSNAFADASEALTPRWCKAPDHWTSRLTQVLWTDCPCCMLARGAVVGVALGGVLGAVLGAAFVVLASPRRS